MESSSPEQIRKSVNGHIRLAGLIASLTIASVGIAVAIDLPAPMNLVVALLIAIVQATIVGYFLMHLKTETPLIFRVLLITGIFLLAMLILTGIALRDPIPKLF